MNEDKFFIDTAIFLSYSHSFETYHTHTLDFFRLNPYLVTSERVISEIIHLRKRRDRLYKNLLKFLSLIKMTEKSVTAADELYQQYICLFPVDNPNDKIHMPLLFKEICDRVGTTTGDIKTTFITNARGAINLILKRIDESMEGIKERSPSKNDPTLVSILCSIITSENDALIVSDGAYWANESGGNSKKFVTSDVEHILKNQEQIIKELIKYFGRDTPLEFIHIKDT